MCTGKTERNSLSVAESYNTWSYTRLGGEIEHKPQTPHSEKHSYRF